MRRSPLGVAVLVGVAGALIFVPEGSRAQSQSRLELENVDGREAVAREAIVRLRQPLRQAAFNDLARETDPEALEQVSRAGIFRVRSRSLDATALIERLARRSDVVYAEPNYIIRIQSTTPNDPYYPYLWGFETIQAGPAWDLSTGSSSNVVAVIDTGIDYTHEDLKANMWSAPQAFQVVIGGQVIACAKGTHGFNAITRSCNPMDDHSHGTHVAGTIGAVGNNAVGVAGVNWAARLLAIKFLDSTGSGTMADAIASMEFAMAVKEAFASSEGANIRVLSNSWGGPDFSQAFLDQVNLANGHDMLFVAAAGNNGTNNDAAPIYPASYDAPNVVSVAATSLNDAPAWFSNFGAVSVDLAAPGDFILSTTPGNGYAFQSGTSMAAPHVSGAAALVLAHCGLDTAALKETLLGTVDPVAAFSGLTATGGRLNANSALHACTGPPAAPTGLKARGGDSQVTLSWSPSLGATRYNVRRSPVAGGPYALLAPDVTGASYVDGGVINGTTYYYVVSAENALGESGDSNEASATPNIPADLLVSPLTVPAVGGEGSVITVSLTTRNQGTGSAGASTTKLYLSANILLEPSDLLLGGAQPVPPLAPGASASSSTTVSIPAGVATGTYFVIAQADADDVLDESDETNNLASSVLRIGPDLWLSSFTVPATAPAGGTISMAHTVANQGGGAAGASRVVFYLSVDGAIGAGDVLLGSRDVPGLGAGEASAASTAVTIPSSTAVGTYFVMARTDADDSVVETSEFNNTVPRLIQVGGDLIVSALTVPAAATPGLPIVVSDTTKNQGSGAVTASVTRFYLSVNALIDSGDTLLSGSRAVPALGAGASSSGATAVTIPAGTTSGLYYLIAQADADNAVAETYETNNGLARLVNIGSDLVVAALTAPATGAPGATLLVSDTTKNQGTGIAAASVTRFYLSTNALWDSGDVMLSAARQIPQLGPAASSTGSTMVTLPGALNTGTYYLIAKADADNAVVETNENNNTMARPLQVGGDLVFSALTVPTKAGAGSSIVISDTTKNQGSASVGPTTTSFYLSASIQLDANATLLGSRAVPALAPGAGHFGSTTVAIPPATGVGSYWIIAKVDAEEAAAETVETNNTGLRSVAVGPDLIVSLASLSSTSIPAGGAVGVTDTVTNVGGGAASGSITRFYLSADYILDPGDLALAPGRTVPGLAAGGASSGTTALTIPLATAPGTYYLLVQADGEAAVVETYESNNVAPRVMIVTTAP